jgi:hypothetical protein
MFQLLTLAEVLKLKPGLRAFLVVLKNRLVVEIGPDKSRRLKIDLALTDRTIINSQQKQAVQEEYYDNTEQARFVAQLDHHGIHAYDGKVPWRFGSAGYAVRLIIGGEAYWALLHRSGVKPNGWNLFIGATVSLAELLRPQDAAERKGKLELIVINVATGKYQRLEVCGGKYMPMKLHRKVLRTMCVTAHMNDEPLIGAVAGDLPDVVYVKEVWEKDRGPFVSARGLLIFNPENGEIGLEFIQVVEWKLDLPLHALRLFDGESFEAGAEVSGHESGRPIGQPIGLFRERDLIREIQKPSPVLRPYVVYENGFAHAGAELERWLEGHPDWQNYCPVTLKTARRFLLDVRGLGNSFVLTPGSRWHVTFEGTTFEINDSRGLRIIAHLIQNAGRIMSFDAINTLFNPPPLPDEILGKFSEPQLQEIGLTMLGSAYESKDPNRGRLHRLEQEKVSLGEELKRLQEEAEDAVVLNDFAKLAEFEEKIGKIRKAIELKNKQIKEVEAAQIRYQGMKGPTRNPEFKRMKNRIVRNIQRVEREISGQHREFATHLRKFLTHDRGCLYQPPPHVTWTLRGL